MILSYYKNNNQRMLKVCKFARTIITYLRVFIHHAIQLIVSRLQFFFQSIQ